MVKSLISIIVPVYNTKEFLVKCIESLIYQTYSNIEIILVDDGSTDGSSELCDKYVKTDNRIKVIHKANGGVVAAREDGIKAASGEWLAFVDSDDWVEPNIYEELIKKTNIDPKIDIVWGGIFVDLHNGQQIILPPDINDTESLIHLILDNSIPAWSVNKIYKRDFFDNAHITIRKDCKMMEDTVLLLQLLLNKPIIEYVKQPLYHYNHQNTNSASNDIHGNPMLKALPALEQIYSILKYYNLNSSYFHSFAKTLMCYKIALAKQYNLSISKKAFPYSHKKISNYPLNGFAKYLFWLFYNIPILGSFLWNIYTIYKRD